MQWPAGAMEDAYARCGVITKDYAKTFYLVSIADLWACTSAQGSRRLLLHVHVHISGWGGC